MVMSPSVYSMICRNRLNGLIIVVVAALFVGGTMAGSVDKEDCTGSNTISCHGARVFKTVIQSLSKSTERGRAMKLMPGIEVIEVARATGRAAGGGADTAADDKTMFGRMAKYLQTHEVKIKFPELMGGKVGFQDVLVGALKNLDDTKDVVEGRKKDKGGLGMVMAMGLMMGKMMAALKLGVVGMLAMKALGVSLMALMLAAIIGLKKLAEGNHDDGGHHVQYITAHDHHRRRRDVSDDDADTLAYRGWTSGQSDDQTNEELN